jgi:hypothetical protein
MLNFASARLAPTRLPKVYVNRTKQQLDLIPEESPNSPDSSPIEKC